MKRIVSLFTLLCLAGAMCACESSGQSEESGWKLEGMPEVTAPEIQIPSMTVPDIEVTKPALDLPDTAVPQYGEQETAAAVPEGAIADESGGFVYTGKLDQVGDDENGYIKVPLDYVRFQDADVSGMLQYSDTSGKNIISLDYYKDMDYAAVAESMRAYLESQDDAQGVTGARVSPNGYDAYQVYCHYTDGYFLVAWAIKDPADPGSSYYMTIEFDSEHQDIMACSSTFRTVEDYHAAADAGA